MGSTGNRPLLLPCPQTYQPWHRCCALPHSGPPLPPPHAELPHRNATPGLQGVWHSQGEDGTLHMLTMVGRLGWAAQDLRLSTALVEVPVCLWVFHCPLHPICLSGGVV